MTTESHPRPLAVVTGASSGIGAAFAQRLARDQHDLLVVARRRDRLETLARQLTDRHQVTVETLVADLADPVDVRAVEQRLARDSALALLVNNAGFGAFMPFVELEADEAEELIRVGITTVTRLTRAALPGMIRRGSGAIINVSSRLAMSAALGSPPMPPRAVYASTKAYINAFTQILHSELEGTGVQVQALCPGLVRTEFFERMGMDPVSLPGAEIMDPEAVVAASLAGLGLGEVICVPALDDPSRLRQVDESYRNVFEHSNGPALAQRYRT